MSDKSAEDLLDGVQQRADDLGTPAPLPARSGALTIDDTLAEEMLDLLRDIRSLLKKIKKALDN